MGIAELTLQTCDLAGMERFYTEVIGLPVLSREDDRVWLAAGKHSRLGLWTRGEKEFGDQGGRHVHYALSLPADALDALTKRLAAAPVEDHGPIKHDGGDRSVYWTDPEGNVGEAWELFAEGGTVADVADDDLVS